MRRSQVVSVAIALVLAGVLLTGVVVPSMSGGETRTATSTQITTKTATTTVQNGVTALYAELEERRGRKGLTVFSNCSRLEATYYGPVTETTVQDEMEEYGLAFASIVEHGYTGSDLHVAVLSADVSPEEAVNHQIGTFVVKHDWARAYNNGTLTTDEFTQRIYTTLTLDSNQWFDTEGCETKADSTPPTTEVTSEEKSGPELSLDSTNPAVVLDAIGTHIERNSTSITVQKSTVDEYGPVMEYKTESTTRDAIRKEVALVATYYAEGVAQSPDLLGIPVWVYGPDGSLIGSYEIDRDWAEAFNNGTLSRDEYIDRVMETWVAA